MENTDSYPFPSCLVSRRHVRGVNSYGSAYIDSVVPLSAMLKSLNMM